jgi:predicted nucleotidyltransferase component of viral defense system
MKCAMSLSQYYEEKLYRIQDGILQGCADTETPFYLTGGTALSRVYYHHRYSDDLDFFVNSDENFKSHVTDVLYNLKTRGLTYDEDGLSMLGSFVSVYIKDPDNDAEVKVDFVNDIDVHYDGFNETVIYPKVDSVRNILSNKIGAVFRLSGKDVADIRAIALHETFDWSEIITEARNKDGGIDAGAISEIIFATPRRAFDDVIWTEPLPSWDDFQNDIHIIARDITSCTENSLHSRLGA